ncbi:hypothetical protein, partial [Limnohabitans sp.]|uniref:hypothetical protein n=1 Tax=Limnohabitans sp. TaxID=1907725 RepID=UPI0033401E8C
MFIDPTVDAQGFVQFPLEVPRLAERTQCQIIHVETPVSAGPGRSAHMFCTQAALPVPEEKPLAEVCAIKAPCWCKGGGRPLAHPHVLLLMQPVHAACAPTYRGYGG